MISPDQTRSVLLDACCVLNLFATGRAGEILQSLPLDIAVVERVVAEALFVRRSGSGEDADELEPVDLASMIGAGIVRVVSVESETEAASYVAFAAHLDDGEAMTCAIALHRGYMVATDDRKALRLLRTIVPSDHIVTTPSLIKLWADTGPLSHLTLRDMLLRIHERARFRPGRNDPLKEWWDSIVMTA